MFGKRTYCILGTMLLAIASLGAGVSAEQSEEPLESIEADSDVERADDLRRELCERGTIRGIFTLDETGNGTLRGLVYNHDGQLMGSMWGQLNADGFAVGQGSTDSQLGVQWKAIYMDGEFRGLWKMTDPSDETRGVLKGLYEVNETGDGGVFHGKWKETGCHDMRVLVEDGPVLKHGNDNVVRKKPGHFLAHPIDTQPMDITPKQKPLMEKLGDVMDEPLVEDEEGSIVDVGDAAAGSTLGTIALLGAGFIRRRITGGL